MDDPSILIDGKLLNKWLENYSDRVDILVCKQAQQNVCPMHEKRIAGKLKV